MKATHTQNYGRTYNVLTLTLKRFALFVHWCGSEKQKMFSFAQVALAINYNSREIHCLMSELHVKFHLKSWLSTHRFAIHWISVFHVKFNVEFSHQAVNFFSRYHTYDFPAAYMPV